MEGVNHLKKLLDGLDVAHAEVVHSQLLYDPINQAFLPLIGYGDENERTVEAYRKECERLCKDGDASVLPELNAICYKIISAIEEEEKQGGLKKGLTSEIVENVERVVRKPVKIFQATLANDMDAAWKGVMAANNLDATFKALAPFLLKISKQEKKGCLEMAAGNFYCLFEYLAKTKDAHQDWFNEKSQDGESSDVVFLTDAAAAVYSHLRQREDLPKELGENMDERLILFNEKTKLFGDWSLSIYADMLFPMGYQDNDYSDLDELDYWQDFLAYLQKMGMTEC